MAKNPFKMPSDAEVFQLRDEERRRKKAERDVMRRLKVRLVVVVVAVVNAAVVVVVVNDVGGGEGERPKGVLSTLGAPPPWPCWWRKGTLVG